jgi:arabinofuranosyltransferase
MVKLRVSRRWLGQQLKGVPSRGLVIVLAPIFTLAVLLPNAWINEDTFISLRVAKNIVLGFGPRFNLDDRVQVFTHPLWMLPLTTLQWLFGPRAPVAIILFCIALTLTAVLLLMRDLKKRWVMVFALALMLSSKAFIDFSTSGLENPLLYVLVVLFAHEYLGKQRVFRLSLIASLVAVTRADAAALMLPAFIPLVYQQWRHREFWTDLFKGAIPLFVWEAFSLLYFGYLLPNTDYAKVITTYMNPEVTGQHAFNYFANSLDWDKVTLPIIALVLIATDLDRRHHRRLWLSLGIVLYLLAVVKAGGDYMSGRFFAVPFFLALYLVALWLDQPWHLPKLFKPAIAAAMLLLAVITPQSPIFHPLDTQLAGDYNDNILGIVSDIGQFYCPSMCLANLSNFKPDTELVNQGHFPVSTAVGMATYYGRINAHIIDPLGLADPLLAHLPASPDSRVGHFIRTVPDGYLASLQTHKNLIKDPCIRALYTDIEPVTSGNLLSLQRFKKIIKLNLGLSDKKFAKCAKLNPSQQP